MSDLCMHQVTLEWILPGVDTRCSSKCLALKRIYVNAIIFCIMNNNPHTTIYTIPYTCILQTLALSSKQALCIWAQQGDVVGSLNFLFSFLVLICIVYINTEEQIQL